MAWKKGQSGNPSGRPKSLREVTELARENSARAIERLVELMDDEDGRVALAAANSILDRGYGKPKQSIEIEEKSPGEMSDQEIRAAVAELLTKYGEEKQSMDSGGSEPDLH